MIKDRKKENQIAKEHEGHIARNMRRAAQELLDAADHLESGQGFRWSRVIGSMFEVKNTLDRCKRQINRIAKACERDITIMDVIKQEREERK